MSNTTATPQAGAAGAPDYAAIKQRQQAGWASGDFAVIGVTLQPVGESLAEAADIRAHEDVIDIAAGNGNATLAAARRFARVVSTDYVPALLDKGRARAEAEGLAVTFRVADAEALPFADASFDAALSTFGVMFTPDHRRAASEMLRVLRPGGRIGMANWTPDGFIGQLFKTIGKYVPPPAGVVSPARWGEEAYVRDLFGLAVEQMHSQRKVFNFRYASAHHWVQVFRDYYGPVHKAFAALDAAGAEALEQDLFILLERLNTAGAHSLVVPGEYLEVIIDKRRG
ncbi:class I SAM-dependent methyltransferase [Janthinobacterium svalbardensis]|uniref:class I SAM-dependent methyltransferase n=1 Tax=Janthinobacterium svalbardensis TaxID=368607 RepID=UPI002FCDDF04